jgi:hypothetical protein
MDEYFRLNAQEATEELFREKRIPFKLTVKEVRILGDDFPDYYRIRFADRLGDMTLFWKAGRESFKTAVREVIEREIRGED